MKNKKNYLLVKRNQRYNLIKYKFWDMYNTVINILYFNLRNLKIILLYIFFQMVFIAFHVETTIWTTHKNTVFFFLGFSLCLGLYLYTFGNITSLCPSIKALLFLLIIGVSYINYNLNLNNKRNVRINIYLISS